MSVGIVTGAAQGIGRAIAERLARDVDRLVLVDLSPRLAETASDLEEPVIVTPVQVDLVEPASIELVVEAVGDEEIATLVNNAGVTRDARLVNMSEADFRLVLDVNLGLSLIHI